MLHDAAADNGKMVIVDDYAWPAPPDDPDPKLKTPFWPEMEAGKLDVAHTFKDIIDKFKKEHNLQ